MKQFFRLLVFCFISFNAQAQSTNDERLGPNLLKNPGFEEGKSNWTISSNATVVEGAGYNSKFALSVKNDDPEKKASGTGQKLVIDPGSTIFFKAKVKGNDLKSKAVKPEADGARLYIQAYDQFGKIIGGRYPKLSGLGTFDWKELSGDFTVPIEAVSVTIAVALYPGVTGECWFDDVTVQVEKPTLIESFLLKPHYRGVMMENENQQIRDKIIINRSYYGNIKSEILVSYDLRDVRNKSVAKHEERIPADVSETTVSFPLKQRLREGDYILNVEYKESSKVHDFSRRHTIEVLKNWPIVHIDERGNTIKEGKKIFPFGVYIGHPDEEHLDRISKAGFNTILSYGYGHNKNYEDYLDRADKHGLNVIYSLKDFYPGSALKLGKTDPMEVAREYVNNIKNKPALLAWYTVDELLPSWMPKIQALYDEVRMQDPDHPALQVHYYDGYRMLEKYYYNGDIIATDPYPVGRSDLSLTSTRVGAGYKATHQTRGHWAVLQMMDWAVYQKEKTPNPPNLDELRNQCYQAVVHGAKGILFYTYYDLFQEKFPRKPSLDYDNFNKIWPDVVKMSTEFSQYIPLFLEGIDYPLKIVENQKIEIKCLEYEGAYYLVVANPFYEKRQISIEIPEAWEVKELKQHNIEAKIENKVITLQLMSLGSGVFKVK